MVSYYNRMSGNNVESLPPPHSRRVLGTIEEREREHNSPEEKNKQ
jgi:hypothetical protein